MKGALSLLFLCFMVTVGMASPFAVLNYKIFYIPGEGPLIEVYLDFDSKSVVLTRNEEGLLRGLVETTIIFKQDDKVVTFDKKVIETPWMQPDDIIDFLDVQRFQIAGGIYTLELHLTDLNNSENPTVQFELELEVPQPIDGLFFSDIELVHGFKKTVSQNMYSKSGFDLLPMVSDDYVGGQANELLLYAELYNSAEVFQDDKFLMSIYIADPATGDAYPNTQKFERKSAAEVVPILTAIPVADLETGDYQIVVEARDRNNELLAQTKHSFTRNHPGKKIDIDNLDENILKSSWVALYDKKDELFEHLQSTRPIVDDGERYALETSFENPYDPELGHMQRYFFAFWEKRAPGNGEMAWLSYKEKVDFVQKEFGTRNKRGYETDRGRVYLQYGPPVDITDRSNEPSSYPYHIWRYYKAGRWNNVRFVFFDPQLTGADYVLLHCEGIIGETRNPHWRLMLEQRNTPMFDVDQRQGTPHFGGRVDELFENPR